MTKKKIIVAISGASGSVYGIRLLKILKEAGVETHFVISKAGGVTLGAETGLSVSEVNNYADYSYSVGDVGASIASGSFKTDGMVIAPCSANTLGSIAHSLENNLISRAAGVILKEKRKLILMVRETPLHRGHLENMLKASDSGAVIAPPVPSFYFPPGSIEEMVDRSLSRILDLFDIETGVKRWEGLKR